MVTYTMMTEYDTSHIFNNYDWKSLGPVKMVDVGGGAGHHSIELARRFPNLSVIVQDMDKMFEGVKIPEELEGRFKFMAYDLFAPQTIQADVYFFRWIFHNWSDKYSVLIIKALIPALKPGAKIILNESCMPEPGEIAHWREKDLRLVILAHPYVIFDMLTQTRYKGRLILVWAHPSIRMSEASMNRKLCSLRQTQDSSSRKCLEPKTLHSQSSSLSGLMGRISIIYN